MVRDEVIKVIKDFSGIVDENGKWSGNSVVAPLITRVYLGAPEILLKMDEEKCKKNIVRVVRQLTGIEIPKIYDPVFWDSDKGKTVVDKLDKRLPELPEVRKINQS